MFGFPVVRHLPRVVPVLLLTALGISAPVDAQQEPYRSVCGASVHVDRESGWTWLPQGRLFCPLAADPKAERSFVSYLRGGFSVLADPTRTDTNIAAVGLGDSFAILRLPGIRPGNGVQLDLSAAVFSQFNLDRPSFDLINADYLVGLPVTVRVDGFSSRLRVYHQSSHLGDEFLLGSDPDDRINLSFEAVELILSQEIGRVRVYAGGENFFRAEPADLAERLAHAGAEIRPVVWGGGRLMGAVDFKSVQESDGWKQAWSAKAAVEIARMPSPGHPGRVLSFAVEYYDGVAPYGQFYREDIGYWGVSFQLYR